MPKGRLAGKLESENVAVNKSVNVTRNLLPKHKEKNSSQSNVNMYNSIEQEKAFQLPPLSNLHEKIYHD